MNRRAIIFGALAAPLAAAMPTRSAPALPNNFTIIGGDLIEIAPLTPNQVRTFIGLPTFDGGGWTPVVTGEGGAELTLPSFTEGRALAKYLRAATSPAETQLSRGEAG